MQRKYGKQGISESIIRASTLLQRTMFCNQAIRFDPRKAIRGMMPMVVEGKRSVKFRGATQRIFQPINHDKYACPAKPSPSHPTRYAVLCWRRWGVNSLTETERTVQPALPRSLSRQVITTCFFFFCDRHMAKSPGMKAHNWQRAWNPNRARRMKLQVRKKWK